jgi:hypothetical protein
VDIASAQDRSSGGMVVPMGWEQQLMMRFAIDAGFQYPPFKDSPNATLTSLSLDTIFCGFGGGFGGIAYDQAVTGLRKGYACTTENPSGQDSIDNLHIYAVGQSMKQMLFYPFENAVYDDPGYKWRYHDPSMTLLNNTFDANDISPYAEFPQSQTIVTQTFKTFRWDTAHAYFPCYGNQGRIILGYSDLRLASRMLRTLANPYIPWLHGDTARNYSAILEFQIDTSSILMDSIAGSTSTDSDNAPLIRLQLTYKKGSVGGTDHGWSVLPYVPFRTSSKPDNPGWWLVVDTTITRKVYRELNNSWRAPDTVGTSDAHGWCFKQLHITLDLSKLDTSFRYLIRPAGNVKADFGGLVLGSHPGFASGFQHPDSLVAVDSNAYKPGSTIPVASQNLLECSVLSTFRSKVRVRSFAWEDTVADKFFYRKRISRDSTHSLNQNGSIGGLDDSLQNNVNLVASKVHSVAAQREIFWWDDSYTFNYLSASAIALCDWMLSKQGMHAHIHEQDAGEGWYLRQFRRERMSQDGQPPSMFENQFTIFNANTKAIVDTVHMPDDVFPLDYVFYAWPVDYTKRWLAPASDVSYGIVIDRADFIGPDTLAAYHLYTSLRAGINDYCNALRATTKVALLHPFKKRMAIEAQLQGWGLFSFSNQKFGQRPTTPEETSAQMFGAIANGVASFSSAQAVDLPENHVGWGPGADAGPGLFSSQYRDSTSQDIKLAHDYNWGHHRITGSFPGAWPTGKTCDSDGMPVPYYLGYSNTWRSIYRTFSRINQLYDTVGGNRYPFKRFRWLDAYSENRIDIHGPSYNLSDLTSSQNSFLKVLYTKAVNPWTRNSNNSYIDAGTPDSVRNSFVEVGLFVDSTSGSDKHYATLLVNTRLQPSLRDAEDTLYYNQGLALKDHCHPTLGDIDVRKIYMTIDTSKFEASFRSPYYVARDLWHPDTTWLVKCDSAFAVYIKPGDAKFLYFEKGISIKAAVASEIHDSADFCFNNGHRVAERMNKTRDVITYTRNHHVYVSYPSQGLTFSKHEQSGADNIATGIEVPIDTTHFCAHPSIMVARNDTGVALVYWMIDSSNDKVVPTYWLRAAYQPHPDSAWKIAQDVTTQFADASTLKDLVTPVIAPISDTTWMIAAVVNPTGSTGRSVIKGLKYHTPVGAASHFDLRDTTLVTAPDEGVKIYFPTCASRPLPDSKYPFRLAWQYRNQIYYDRYRFDGAYFARHDSTFCVSAGLNQCQNVHPCIATNGTRYRYPLGEGGTGDYSNVWIDDDVTWEAMTIQPFGPAVIAKWLTIIRHRYQTDLVSGHWGGFDAWIKDPTWSPIHWPEITAQHEQYTVVNPYILASDKQPLHDWIRATWQADSLGAIWIAGWIPGTWYTATFGEKGRYPSLGLTTDSIPNWSKDSVVPLSIAFQSYLTHGGSSDVRITNGWVPWIATAHIDPTLWLFVPNDTNCWEVVSSTRLGHGQIGTTPRLFEWLPSDQGRGGQFDDDWPAISRAPNELHTSIFAIHSGETLTLNRTMDIPALTTLRSHLATGSDYVQWLITLRRWADSSYIATVDSFYISGTVNLSPGFGLPPMTSAISLGSVGDDSAFLSVELKRGDTTNTLMRTLLEEVSDSLNVGGSYKIAISKPKTQPTTLALTVHPNPFNPTTWIEMTSSPSLHVTLELYDLLGRRLQTLYDADSPQSGNLHLVLDASVLPSGAYLLRATSGNEVVSTRIELVK